MTEEELQAIEARASAVTPLPWVVEHYTDGYEAFYVGGEYVSPEQNTTVCYYQVGENEEFDEQDREDLARDFAFIAAARQDVPSLVAEVRRLRALVRTTTAEEREACAKIVESQIETRGSRHWDLCDDLNDRNTMRKEIAAAIRERGGP